LRTKTNSLSRDTANGVQATPNLSNSMPLNVLHSILAKPDLVALLLDSKVAESTAAVCRSLDEASLQTFQASVVKEIAQVSDDAIKSGLRSMLEIVQPILLIKKKERLAQSEEDGNERQARVVKMLRTVVETPSDAEASSSCRGGCWRGTLSRGGSGKFGVYAHLISSDAPPRKGSADSTDSFTSTNSVTADCPSCLRSIRDFNLTQRVLFSEVSRKLQYESPHILVLLPLPSSIAAFGEVVTYLQTKQRAGFANNLEGGASACLVPPGAFARSILGEANNALYGKGLVCVVDSNK